MAVLVVIVLMDIKEKITEFVGFVLSDKRSEVKMI